MKFVVFFSLFTLSVSAFASCKDEARNIAEEAVRLFDVNDSGIHCMAMGGLTSLAPQMTIQVMPPRYSYIANFEYPCGPQPKSPKVIMLLNEECKIVQLDVRGFDLE